MSEEERLAYLEEERELLIDRISEAPPEEAEELKTYLRETEEEIEKMRKLGGSSSSEEKRPPLKDLMAGRVLDGYVEAARVRPLTEFTEEGKAEELRRKIRERRERILRLLGER